MLTGQIRHRTEASLGPYTTKCVLVLQVEDTHPDGTRFWRDALTEDLTTMTLNNLTEVKRQ